MEQPADEPQSTIDETEEWNRSLAHLIALTPSDVLARATTVGVAARFATATMREVAREVSAYADEGGQATTTSSLSSTLLEIAEDIAESPTPLDERTATTIGQRLHDLGFAETHRAISLDDLSRVATVALRQLWREFHRLAITRGWDSDLLGEVGETLLLVRQHVDRLITEGQQSAGKPPRDPHVVQDRLILALVREGNDNPEQWLDLAARCDAAHWELPDQLVVIRLHHDAATVRPLVPDTVLVDQISAPTRLIVPAPLSEATTDRLTAGLTKPRLAISTPVAPSDCASGDRWARRALELIDAGVLNPAPATWCDDHTALLWLHAEPEIRRRLVQEFLGPLLNEGPTTRISLAETMLAWLTTRDSAPVIAERLDVHAQTVRYRWRRLTELFGDQLRDPEFIGMVTLLLRATVPLWRSGDDADLEAFRNNR
ncbi:helix-turn-helix domain-containing protein [Nocardioides sp. Bht2]|uniref:PucR family transcriptional regulator n=1 Tax=Nocardioides sp. Bht2 TaxID=3392297 RepID=UPI0039B44C9A